MKGLEALEELKQDLTPRRLSILGKLNRYNIIEKELKALNEIVALYDKWLGNEMSDFEFFTLLNDIKCKYGLENEVLK